MDHFVVRSGTGPDPGVIRQLAQLGVSTTHEAMGRSGLMQPYLRPIFPGAAVAGRAVTVLTQAGDNLMLHAAIEQTRPGDVLVLATMSRSTDGMFGDLLATAAQARGVVALVTDGGVRDVATLTKMGFPVWSRAISAQGTVKATAGSVNIPVVVGGVLVNPGDLVVADDDGVVVVPLLAAERVLAAAARRAEEEEHKRALLAGGELSLDLYDLRRELTRLGVRYVGDQNGSADGDGAPEESNGEVAASGAVPDGATVAGKLREGPDPQPA